MSYAVRMRLFVAAELPNELLEALAETQAVLRARVQGRYVAPGQFHVTLAFLGTVDSWRVDDAARALDYACAGHTPFDVQLESLGSFGRRNTATLWQGFVSNASFEALAHDVRDALSQEEFDFDTKRFLPHVTLMRAANLESGSLPMPTLASDTIDTVTLFSSDLSGERPVYSALHSASF